MVVTERERFLARSAPSELVDPFRVLLRGGEVLVDPQGLFVVARCDFEVARQLRYQTRQVETFRRTVVEVERSS